MGISMFIVGFIIFSIYLYFMISNIFYSNKNKEKRTTLIMIIAMKLIMMV